MNTETTNVSILLTSIMHVICTTRTNINNRLELSLKKRLLIQQRRQVSGVHQVKNKIIYIDISMDVTVISKVFEIILLLAFCS